MPRVALVALVALQCFASALQPAINVRKSPLVIKRSALVVADASTVKGTASLPSSTINLAKAIVGAGCLSLPVGIAAFSKARNAIWPALGLAGLITLISAYCFSMVARVCEATQSKTWGEAWTRTVGESTSWIPSSFVALLCASQTLQYTMVIGDSFASIFAAARLPALIASRTGAIGLITSLFTLPLCLLPSLEMLQYTSFLGIGGLLYTAAFMILRIGAYAPGSALHAAVPPHLQPSFCASPPLTTSVLAMFTSSGTFILMSILATAFCAHFLAPAFYKELSDGTDPNVI